MAGWLSSYADRLNRSVAALFALLDRPRVSRRSVLALLAIQSALLAYSAFVHSPTLNEPGHLVAGLSYWKFGRFDVYNVNPPLVKMMAALPVMAVGYEEDWSGFYTGPGARPEFKMGKDFVAANGERSFFLFTIARWACIPFSWIGGIVCYLWARDLYGRPAGVIACAIWSFEPNILAHASLMTPDAHATALGLAACYTFWRWLKHPTWTQAIVTGVILGLAELAKTTLILFYPLWPLLWLFYRWFDRRRMQLSDWLCEAGMLATRMIIGLYVVNLGYGFEDSLRPLGDYEFASKLFAGEESRKPATSVGAPITSHQLPVAVLRNRFAGKWLGTIPVPFPRNYLVGIDLQQRDFEDYGRLSYLRGEWRDGGWWYYYLYAIAIKAPLGLLALGIMAALALCFRRSPVEWRDTFILVLPPLVVFIVVSSKTGISEHMRYVLPCFPFAYILIAGFSMNLIDREAREPISRQSGEGRMVSKLATPLLVTLLFWFASSSAWIYPHSLSYFNESIGGPLNGSAHLLGSNLDWGQDLRYLDWWMRSEDVGEAFFIDLVGMLDPNALGIPLSRYSGQSHWRYSDTILESDPAHYVDRKTPIVSTRNTLQAGRRETCDCGELGETRMERPLPSIAIAYSMHIYFCGAGM